MLPFQKNRFRGISPRFGGAEQCELAGAISRYFNGRSAAFVALDWGEVRPIRPDVFYVL
jgi:hypothetical protein